MPSLCIALTIIWATIAPLVIPTGIRYWTTIPDEHSAFKAKIIKLTAGGKAHLLTIVVFTDPIRPRLASMLDTIQGLQMRHLDLQRVGETLFLVPPLETAFTQVVSTSSASQKNFTLLLNAPVDGISLDFGIYPENRFLIRTGVHANLGRLISRTQRISSSVPVWHSVRCGAEVSDEELEYASLLDYALTIASQGEVSSAMSGLFEAAKRSPSDLERARATSLIAALSFRLLGGTLGELQSLAYYREAAEYLHKAMSAERIDDYDLVVIESLRLKLVHLMGRDKSFFKEDLASLGYQPTDIIDQPMTTFTSMIDAFANGDDYFDNYARKLARVSKSEFLAEAKKATRDPLTSRLFFESGFGLLLQSMADPQPFVPEVRNALELTSRASDTPWRESFGRLLELFPASPDDLDQDKFMVKGFRSRGMRISAEMVSNPSYAFSQPIPNADWWEPAFLDWFTSFLMSQSQASKSALVNANLLIRDHRGTGRIFLPGLALVAYTAYQKGDLEFAESLDREFKKEIGVDIHGYFDNPPQLPN